jgi:hypothetical protein
MEGQGKELLSSSEVKKAYFGDISRKFSTEALL